MKTHLIEYRYRRSDDDPVDPCRGVRCRTSKHRALLVNSSQIVLIINWVGKIYLTIIEGKNKRGAFQYTLKFPGIPLPERNFRAMMTFEIPDEMGRDIIQSALWEPRFNAIQNECLQLLEKIPKNYLEDYKITNVSLLDRKRQLSFPPEENLTMYP